MKWTRDKPTATDWWWYRAAGGWKGVVHVEFGSYVGNVVWFAGNSEERLLNRCDGEWAGPLSPPEE